MRVYLAGHWKTPWRDTVLAEVCAEWRLPTRPETVGGADPGRYFPRDIALIRDSDVVFAHISDDARNIGTVAEIGFAYALGKPIILYDTAGNGFDFPRKMATTTAATLPEAISTLRFVCNCDERPEAMT